MTDVVNAGIYARISQDREGRELGVRRQIEDCHALAERLGWTVLDVYQDNDISASSKSRKARPEYARLLGDVDAGRVTGILAYSTSRLTRRPMEWEGLISRAESGLHIQTVAAGKVDLSTANGRMIARVIAAMDANEAEQTSERIKRQRAQLRQMGRWGGGMRPFGFEADGRTHVFGEAEMLRDAAAAILSGRGMAWVAAQWDQVTPPPRWHPPYVVPRWRTTVIRDMLTNPRVAGLQTDGSRTVWEPIIPEGTWRAVRALLLDPSRSQNQPRGPQRLLTGIALCGVCGATVVAWQSAVEAPGARKYKCGTSHHLTRSADPVDLHVEAKVLLQLESFPRVRPTSDADVASLVARAEMLRAAIDEAADAYAEDVIAGRGTSDARQLRRITARLEQELRTVEDQMTQSSYASALAEVPVGRERILDWWDALDLEGRRATIRALTSRIVLHKLGQGRRHSPESVTVEFHE